MEHGVNAISQEGDMPISEEPIKEERVGEALSSSSAENIKQEDEKGNDTQGQMGEMNRYKESLDLQEFSRGLLEIKEKITRLNGSILKKDNQLEEWMIRNVKSIVNFFSIKEH